MVWESKSPKLWSVPSFFFFFLFFVVALFLFWGDRKRERKQWTHIWHFRCTKNFLFWLFCTNLWGKCWFPSFAKKEAGTPIEKLQLLKVTQLVHGGEWVCPQWTWLASKPLCCLLPSSSPPPFSSLFHACLFQPCQRELLAAFILGPGNAKVMISHLWRGHFNSAREFHGWADRTIQCPMAQFTKSCESLLNSW